jgi:hypothetical protein
VPLLFVVLAEASCRIVWCSKASSVLVNGTSVVATNRWFNVANMLDLKDALSVVVCGLVVPTFPSHDFDFFVFLFFNKKIELYI